MEMTERILQGAISGWWGIFSEPASTAYRDIVQGKPVLLPKSNETMVKAFQIASQKVFKDVRDFDPNGSLPERILHAIISMIKDSSNPVLPAMRATDRSVFVPPITRDHFKRTGLTEERIDFHIRKGLYQERLGLVKEHPYQMTGVQIGEGQTCSAPYMVALYTALSALTRPKKIFELGAGCGYQLATYANAHRGARLFGLEYFSLLNILATANIRELDKRNRSNLAGRITIETGDGRKLDENETFRENAPYDVISVACMLPTSSDLGDLAKSLNEDGVLIAPIGEGVQEGYQTTRGYLHVAQKKEGRLESIKAASVTFVPLK